MELCTVRALSNLPHHRLFNLTCAHSAWRAPLPLKQVAVFRAKPELLHLTWKFLRAMPEEISNASSQYRGEERDGVLTVSDVSPIAKNVHNESVKTEVKTSAVKTEDKTLAVETELYTEEPPMAQETQEMDSGDAYAIILYGGAALVGLWLASVVVGSIDSIPVIPKLMEVVGLGYSIWFTARYLIFKENRDELVAKIDELKQQVVGLNDD